MTDEERAELFAALRERGGAIEMYERHAFKFYRTTERGEIQAVELEVLDSGPGNYNRYHVSARSDDGRYADGNPAETLHGALARLHWAELG